MTSLGDLATSWTNSHAFGISRDGSTIVGNLSDGDSQAFRWTAADGVVGLGDLPGGTINSGAFGVSGDGSTIVGYGIGTTGQQAFRWTASGGMVGIGDLPGGAFRSVARAVSNDGATVVGQATSASGSEAFRWTAGGGMAGLGDLPGGTFESIAFAVSADGSRVVGYSNSGTNDNAFLWDSLLGMRRLSDVLEAGGVDLGGWALRSAHAMSSNGRFIAGYANNPQGNVEAFLADLGATIVPEPVSLGWAGLGCWLGTASVVARRRNQGRRPKA
jgi:probable HAF family extracellular repeat protein